MLIFQAIETRFLGPTNHRGSRIKAFAQAGSLTVNYDHALSQEANHTAAAKAFAEKLGWVGDNYGELIGGGNAKGDGNVYVLTGRAPDPAPVAERLVALIADGLTFGEVCTVFGNDQDAREPDLSAYVGAARNDDELEVDSSGIVSAGDAAGAWVLSWQWVRDDDAGMEKDDGAEDEA